ncbi:hypothetical protein TYRP_009628, partial [Tyrophagus putrescentiae]
IIFVLVFVEPTFELIRIMLHLSPTTFASSSFSFLLVITMIVCTKASPPMVISSVNGGGGNGNGGGNIGGGNSDEQQQQQQQQQTALSTDENGNGHSSNYYHYLTDSGSVVEFENARLLPAAVAENSVRMLNPLLSSSSSSSSSSASASLPIFGSILSRPSSLSSSPSAYSSNSLSGNVGLAGLSAEHRIVTRGGKQRFCGEMLVSALALVCKGNYRKRSGSPFASNSNGGAPELADYGYQSSENGGINGGNSNNGGAGSGSYLDFFDVLKGASRSGSHGNVNGHELKLFHQASKRGVVDDCCKKPCSTSTLGMYCSI